MPRPYRTIGSVKPSTVGDAYVLEIAATANNTISAITSSKELVVVDASSLAGNSVLLLDRTDAALTCLAVDASGQHVFCGSSGGDVLTYDIRSGQMVSQLHNDKPVTALACRSYDVAAGTEQQHQQSDLRVWDVRQQQVRWQNNENNDDVTALNFHPTNLHFLLAGGDDGLVSMFDTTISEEEESLVQAFNHGPIHKAGFVDAGAVFALSSDQNLVIHPVYDEARDTEPAPVQLGDLRPLVPCEYVIDLLPVGGNLVVATGSHGQSRVDLVNLKGGVELDPADRIMLEHAHEEQIVRSVLFHGSTVFTAGEDGCIKAWTAPT